MTPSEQDPPAVTAAEPPPAGGQVVAAAVALLEAAALIAMRRVASWNPLLPLYAAADRRWTASTGEDQQDWRTDPSRHGAGVRLAVLVAEATIGLCLAKDGHLSARELSVDLRHATARLAARRSVRPVAIVVPGLWVIRRVPSKSRSALNVRVRLPLGSGSYLGRARPRGIGPRGRPSDEWDESRLQRGPVVRP